MKRLYYEGDYATEKLKAELVEGGVPAVWEEIVDGRVVERSLVVQQEEEIAVAWGAGVRNAQAELDLRKREAEDASLAYEATIPLEWVDAQSGERVYEPELDFAARREAAKAERDAAREVALAADRELADVRRASSESGLLEWVDLQSGEHVNPAEAPGFLTSGVHVPIGPGGVTVVVPDDVKDSVVNKVVKAHDPEPPPRAPSVAETVAGILEDPEVSQAEKNRALAAFLRPSGGEA
jgi:hypothetical protein